MVRMAVIYGPGISARAQALLGCNPPTTSCGIARPALSEANLLAREGECNKKNFGIGLIVLQYHGSSRRKPMKHAVGIGLLLGVAFSFKLWIHPNFFFAYTSGRGLRGV